MAKYSKGAKAVKEFIDPPSTKLQDWQWRPLGAVSKDLSLTEIPDYIQKGYGSFMAEQAKRAAAGDLTARDLLKAYLITQSSIGRQGLAHSTATKAGLKVPRTEEMVRPEGAFATWLGSKTGQKYLDAAMKGDLNEKAIAEIQYQFSPFGKQNALGESMVYAAQTIPEMSKRLNQTIMGTPEGYRDYAEGLKGIAGSMSGFIGSMLGRGVLPTFDARQIALHTAGEPLPTASASSVLNRGKGAGGREAVDRLAARQEALGLKIDPALDPYYQHLAHHAVWDKIGGDKTTHQDLIDAMTNYKDGGKVKRRDIEEFKARGAPAAAPRPRATKVSQFEKDFRDYMASQQEARQRLASDLVSPSRIANAAVPGAVGALTGYGSQILGAPGDIVGLYEEFKPESFRSAPTSLQSLPSTEQVQELFAPKADSFMGRRMPEYEAGITGGNMYALGEGVAALPSLARGVGRGAKALGKEAGRRIDEAMMTGEGMLGSALAPVRPNFIFIGPSAKTWDKSAAFKASQMERAGKSPEEIWAATKTFKGADGNWRQEVSDQSARFQTEADMKAKAAAMKDQELANKEAIAQSKLHPDLFPKQLTAAQKDLRAQTKALRDERTAMHGPETGSHWRGNFAKYALEHPELYEAYPDLANLLIKQDVKGGAGQRASLAIFPPRYQGQPVNEHVSMNIYQEGLQHDPRSSALHEMQHAVQGIEGWAAGGDPRDALSHPKWKEMYEAEKARALTPMSLEEYVDTALGGMSREQFVNRYGREPEKNYEGYVRNIPYEVQKADPQLKSIAAMNWYRALGGEAEARAVQARKDMDLAERAQTPPTQTFGKMEYPIPLADQIVTPPTYAHGGTVSQDAMRIKAWDKQVQRKGMGGWMKGAGRTAEEAKRLFDIAKGTRAKAAQVEAGLYHPIGGGIKLSKPVELMQFETMKDPTVKGVQRKIITPEDLQGGIGIPLVGDRAAGGTLLTSVEGMPFRSPLTLEAGPDYMLTHTIPGSPESSIWRSGKGVVSGLQKQVEFARDMGRPIYGVNVVGAPTNVNYNTMVTEAILNQYDPTALTKKAKKEFLKDIRNYAPDPDKPHLKPGSVLTEADLNDVEALRAKMLAEGAGPLRKAFVERMGQAPFQEAGFPDVPASRLATTEPLLVDVPTGSAGFTVGTIDPAARALEQTPRGHKTYPISLAGEYFGSLDRPIDYRDIFQEFADKRRVFGKPEASDWRSFSLAPQFQTFDQEWLDRVMKSAGADKPREWKDGGAVHMAEGGMTSDDLIVEERAL
jgi:hypothetical protein